MCLFCKSNAVKLGKKKEGILFLVCLDAYTHTHTKKKAIVKKKG